MRRLINVGVLTPHAAAGPEAEFPLMAAGQVHTRVSRIRSPETAESSAPPSSPRGLRALSEPTILHTAVGDLTPSTLDALAYASTSSAYVIGHQAEQDLVDHLSAHWSIPASSTNLSVVVALRRFQVRRLAIVHPPWFGAELNELGAAYFESQGFVVKTSVLATIESDPSRVEPGMVIDWIAGNLSVAVDAVFLGGNGFRAAGAVQELENELGCLVLESNQVLLWSILCQTGAPIDVQGFGMLFHGAHRD